MVYWTTLGFTSTVSQALKWPRVGLANDREHTVCEYIHGIIISKPVTATAACFQRLANETKHTSDDDSKYIDNTDACDIDGHQWQAFTCEHTLKTAHR